MSWFVQVAGTADAVIRHLDEQSAKLDGQSKVEFDEALPHLKGLVAMNVQEGEPRIIIVKASGTASIKDGKRTYSSASVSIEPLNAKLVT